MALNRNKKIILFVVCFSTLMFSMIGYNLVIYYRDLEKYKQCNDSMGCVLFYGNVTHEVHLGHADLISDKFERVENKEFLQLNRYTTQYKETFSGCSLWNVLLKLELLPEEYDINSTYIQFEAPDGFKSYILPMRIVRDFPSDVLIVTHEKGELIKSKDLGGDGPLRGCVGLDSIENDSEMQDIYREMGSDFVFNTIFSVHYLSAIHVIMIEGSEA